MGSESFDELVDHLRGTYGLQPWQVTDVPLPWFRFGNSQQCQARECRDLPVGLGGKHFAILRVYIVEGGAPPGRRSAARRQRGGGPGAAPPRRALQHRQLPDSRSQKRDWRKEMVQKLKDSVRT